MFTVFLTAIVIYLLGVAIAFFYFFHLGWHGDTQTRIFIASCLAIGWPVILVVVLIGWFE